MRQRKYQKSNKFARVLSALGQSAVVKNYCDDLPEVPEDREEIEKSPFKAPRKLLATLTGHPY